MPSVNLSGPELEKKAREIRSAFEQKTVDRSVLKRLYSGYTSVPDMDAFLTQAQAIFPHGNCGLASLYLQHRLGMGEVVQGFYENEPHTFLRLPNNWIVDITADQFKGGPTVYVGRLKPPWQLFNVCNSVAGKPKVGESVDSLLF